MKTNFENQLQEEEVLSINPEEQPVPDKKTKDDESDADEADELQDDMNIGQDDDLDLDEAEEANDEDMEGLA